MIRTGRVIGAQGMAQTSCDWPRTGRTSLRTEWRLEVKMDTGSEEVSLSWGWAGAWRESEFTQREWKSAHLVSPDIFTKWHIYVCPAKVITEGKSDIKLEDRWSTAQLGKSLNTTLKPLDILPWMLGSMKEFWAKDVRDQSGVLITHDRVEAAGLKIGKGLWI